MDQMQDEVDRWWHAASPLERTALLDAARNDLVVSESVRRTLHRALLDEGGRLTRDARLAIDNVEGIEPG